MQDIDSDDEYITCQDCGQNVDISEISCVILITLKKIHMCVTCKSQLPQDAVHESNTDYTDYAIAYPIIEDWDDETILMRKIRLQKEKQRLQQENQEKEEKRLIKRNKQKEESEERELTAELNEKKRWDCLTLGTKICELEVEICSELHGYHIESDRNCYIGKYWRKVWPDYRTCSNPNSVRLELYMDHRFNEIKKNCPVYEEAQKALMNNFQPPHLQVQGNLFETKDRMEDIIRILEKWVDEFNPDYNRIHMGLPRLQKKVFNWSDLKNITSRFL